MNLCMCLWVSLSLGIRYPVFMCKHICMCGYVSIFHLLNKTFYDSLEAQVPGQPLGMRFMLLCMCAQSIQLCLTFCDPMAWSPLGSSVHGIFQTRILEWIVIFFTRDTPNPGTEPAPSASAAMQVGSLPLSHLGNPEIYAPNTS